MAKVTAGRDELGAFAPEFAELNDDVLFGEQAPRPLFVFFVCPACSIEKLEEKQ